MTAAAGDGVTGPERGGRRWSRRAALSVLLGAATAGTGLAVLRADQPADDVDPCPSDPELDYGVNADDAAEVDARLATFGAVGITRVFHGGMLPSTWSSTAEGASASMTTQVSFKTPASSVASGEHDLALRSWMESIPAGWRVYLTYWHEPNDELLDGTMSPAAFRAAWSRLSTLRDQVSLQPDVELSLVPVFMSYLVDTPSGWSDAWVPSAGEVDLLSWDVYGNPATGTGLAGRYPDVASRLDPCLRVTSRLGFTRWAVTEFNTPRRTWDVSEKARTAWLERFRRYAMGEGREVAPELGPPEFLLLWEGVGENWDQRFMTARTTDWWRRVMSCAG